MEITMEAGFHLHAPKTGGTSIIFALLTNSNAFYETYGHYYKNQIAQNYSPLNIPHDVCYCPDHKKFITFGIRNPYDRMLSLIKQVNKQTSQLQNEVLHTTKTYTLKSHLAEIRRYNKIDWNNFYEGHSPPHWSVIATLSQWEDTLCCNCGIKYIRF